MKVLVIGGKLQGIEVTYLAKKAGYHTTVLDYNQEAPAKGLADHFICEDVFSEQKLLEIFLEVDIVIPAMEDSMVLRKLLEYGERTNRKVIFDALCYEISSSKRRSNRLFEELNLPLPGKYPNCQYPVIIKPDDLSGSSNVHRAHSKEEVEAILAKMEGNVVIQEYLEGRSFSLEVLGDGKEFYYPQITEVIVDRSYDCKRVIAPAKISKEIEDQLFIIAKKLAEKLQINGIFDIEVICHNGILKLLEIDARFPSQTPISVYHSCGINMVEMLVNLVLGTFTGMKITTKKVCYYQQIVVDRSGIRVLGEHVIAEGKELRLITDFFGAEEAITDYTSDCDNWRAIVIITANTDGEAHDKFLQCMEHIKNDRINTDFKFIEG